MRVAITCTAPRCDDIVVNLRRQNINAYAMPALNVRHLNVPQPEGDFDAMVVTSHHSITDTLPNMPVIAVGKKTSNILNKKDLNVIQVGGGGVCDLDLTPYNNILYPCSTEPTDVPKNATAWPVYETIPNPDFKIDSKTEILTVFSVKGAKKTNQMTHTASKVICLSQPIADVLIGIEPERLAVCSKPSYDEMEQLIIKAYNT